MGITDWKAARQKTANELFIKLLEQDYKEWLNKHNREENTSNLITFLVKHNVIRQSIVNRFVVVKKYPEELKRLGGKEKAVFSMSNHLVPLEPTGIYTILMHHTTYFRENRLPI